MPRNFSPNDVGVWIDSSLGRFIGEEIQRIAEVEGWVGGFVEADNLCCLDCYTEAIEEAEEYLNNLAPDEHMFGTLEDGSFGLFPLSVWETPLA